MNRSIWELTFLVRVSHAHCAALPEVNRHEVLGYIGNWVLQIGIRAEAIENQVKNVLLDYNHFENIALVKKGLHGTFMHTFMHMLVAALPLRRRSGDVSPGVDGPPVMPEVPYAYVVAAFQALPPPDYVPGPEEPEQAPPSPEQPLPAAVSPTAESPGHILESNPDEDPEEEDDKDPKEDLADYPADHNDDDEEEPSGDDTDEEDEELSIVHCLGYEAGESSVAAAARPIEGRRADYGFVDSVEAEIRRRRTEDIGYGTRDTWIDPRDVAEEEALTTLEGVNPRVTELAAVQEQDTHCGLHNGLTSFADIIGIRVEAIENQVKNVLLDYNHFENIALVKKGLHGTFMHMLVAALVDSEDSTVTYTTISSPYEGRSGDVSPGVDGPPVIPEDPYAYVVVAFQALPPPDYVPSPEEPEQAPPSPEDPADYLVDHDDDVEEEDPSRNDADEEDEEQDEDNDDEEKEHPASADSIPPPPALRVTARISFIPQPPTLSFTKEDAERFLA
nr:hypothetical protein [Tanacetum cinerariifolium]